MAFPEYQRWCCIFDLFPMELIDSFPLSLLLRGINTLALRLFEENTRIV